MRYFSEEIVVRTRPAQVGPAAPFTPVAKRLGPAVLKGLSGDPQTGRCGMNWCGWNGDRARGWGFYCACGFCTPMRRSFSEGLEMLEQYWEKRRAA